MIIKTVTPGVPVKCARKSCEIVFTPTRSRNIYCSPECSDKERQERYWARYRPVLKRAQKANKKAAAVAKKKVKVKKRVVKGV